MRTALLTLLLALSVVAPSLAQTPAGYADRAKLVTDTSFVGRVQIAMLKGALTVLNEDTATPNHTVRVKLAGVALRESEFYARRLSVLAGCVVPAVVAEDGSVTTSVTDAELQTLIDSRWSLIASLLTTS